MKDDTSGAVQTEQRRLAAIMFTDIVGFSRQLGADETRTLRRLAVHNQLIQQAVAAHHGTVIKTVGDAFLVDFPSVVHAVQCAQQIAEQIHVRIGIHLGDWPAHWGSAASYSELGQEEETRIAGVAMLRIMPQFSVERWKRMVPEKDQEMVERWAAALRKAGLK
jgi:adenylate/guanylate cyclase family protein